MLFRKTTTHLLLLQQRHLKNFSSRKPTTFSLLNTSFFEIFDHNFEQNKDNLKTVCRNIESLSLPEKLRVHSHLVRTQHLPLLKNSRAVQWLLKPVNISSFLKLCRDSLNKMKLQDLSQLMVINSKFESQATVKGIIARLRELLPTVRSETELEDALNTISQIKGLPSCRWSSVEAILTRPELLSLVKTSESFRSPTQHVQLFNLIKEFDLSRFDETEQLMVSSIIDSLEHVKPADYLKLLHGLCSHTLFFISKGGNGVSMPLDNLLFESKHTYSSSLSLRLLHEICQKTYNPEVFSAQDLKQSGRVTDSFKAFNNTVIPDLFPEINAVLLRISAENVNRNFSDRRVIPRVFNLARDPAGVSKQIASSLFERFANTLANYACLNLHLVSVFRNTDITIHRVDVSYSLLGVCREFRTSISFFNRVALSFVESEVSDLRKVGLFVESSVALVFPVFFYCYKFRVSGKPNLVVDSFFYSSADFLLYVCNIARSLIQKLRFQEKGLVVMKSTSKLALTRGKTEDFASIVKLINESLLMHSGFFDELGNEQRALVLKKNLKSLAKLIET